MVVKSRILLSALMLLVYVFAHFAPVGLLPGDIGLKPAMAATSIDSIVGDDGSIKISTDEGLKTGVKKTKYLLNMWTVFAILIVAGALIFAFVRLSTSSGQGQSRAEALKGVGWVLIAAAGIGSAALLIGVAYNAFNG